MTFPLVSPEGQAPRINGGVRPGARRHIWAPPVAEHWRNTACCSWGELTEFRRFESGETYPDFDTSIAICQTFGWAQTFVRLR